MKLEIVKVQNPQDELNHHGVEKIYFWATKGANLKDYLLYDATFTDSESPSNKGRHTYRFPNFPIEQDCNIVLWIDEGPRMGEPTGFENRSTPGHRFYWGRNSPIINNTGDTLTLIRVADEQAFEVPAE